ncbi:bifunctional DNA primase/polymerase [Streptomyces sp. NPDC005799]|uniref:bifunctional DNA primase/polymerase n=1 Tax=Streptomyces sp. NPDC005799 TaxID=3154678 RepID=UPI0033DFBEDF
MLRPDEAASPAAPRLTTPHVVARWCAAQGWPVHPLAPGRKTPAGNCPSCRVHQHNATACPCLPAGRPCHGFHAATTRTEYIDDWWAASPSAGVGIACGPANLVVIDIDAHASSVPDRSRLLPGIAIPEAVNLAGLASGFDTLGLLAAFRQQPDPAHDENTLRVRTPSGGLHVWYHNIHPGSRFRCSTGSSPKVALAWQVDIRAEGGYIVAPTTRTSQGSYQPEGAARRPAPLPEWLYLELVRTGHLIESSRPPLPTVPCKRRRSQPTAAYRVMDPLVSQVAQCAAAPEGTSFTEKLNRAAYTAGGLVAAGHLEEATVRDLLLNAAEQARPWQTTRNGKIISDGLAAGIARPFRLGERS